MDTLAIVRSNEEITKQVFAITERDVIITGLQEGTKQMGIEADLEKCRVSEAGKTSRTAMLCQTKQYSDNVWSNAAITRTALQEAGATARTEKEVDGHVQIPLNSSKANMQVALIYAEAIKYYSGSAQFLHHFLKFLFIINAIFYKCIFLDCLLSAKNVEAMTQRWIKAKEFELREQEIEKLKKYGVKIGTNRM